MIVNELCIAGAYVIENTVFSDSRGQFEVFWETNGGITLTPQSAHHSYNPTKFTLRGIHFQKAPFEQAKLVSCVQGLLYDVVVDLRPDSPTYLNWSAAELAAASGKSLYIPKGCGHGFLTLAPNTIVSYMIEGHYNTEASGIVRWDDPAIRIDWPREDFLISDKDRLAPDFNK